MYQLFVWVPTKGWKLIKGSQDRDKLVKLADELEPLETKILNTSTGSSTYGGRLCMPNYELDSKGSPGHEC